jgi:hypothetical protein
MLSCDSYKFKLQENAVLQYWLLAAITVLAALLRLYKIGEWSFWIDEIYTINRAQIHFSDPALLLRNLPSTLWLPISVILTEVFLNVFRVSEWSARLGSTLIGIVSIPILFFPVRKLVGASTALIFVLLLAISPWHLFWSQNARFYTSLLLFYNLAAFVFFYAIEYDRPVYLIFFYILFYFAVSERLIAVFIFPVILAYWFALWLLRFDRPPGLRTRNILLIIVPMLGLILFDAFRFIRTGSSIILDAIKDFSSIIIDDPIRIFILIVYNIGIPLVCMALLSGIYLIKEKNRLGLFLFISAVLTSVSVAAVSLVAFVVDRYAFMTLPSWILLASFGVIEVYRKFRPRGFLLGIGALLLLIADASGVHLMYYQLNEGNRPEWRRAFEYVAEHAKEGDIIISPVPEVGSYYTNQDVISLGEIIPEQIENSEGRYWFVLDSENSWFHEDNKAWVEEHADLIDMFYLRVREKMYLKIYLYTGEYESLAR